MVFLADLQGEERVFKYGLFGVQHDILTPAKQTVISALYNLLAQSSDRVDHLRDENHGLPLAWPRSTTFVAYWLHSEDYDRWKETDAVRDFWENLPDDAGVWREVMTIPKSRFMHASNQNVKSGLGHLLDLKHSNDEGYWSVYRHRLAAITDKHTDPGDTFTSAYTTTTKAKADPSKLVVNLQKPQSTVIRSGRIHISKVPDNLCFAREGQRLPNVSKEERDTWLESIAPHAQSWIEHLDTERNKTGVLYFTTHVRHEKLASTVAEPMRDFDPAADLQSDSEAIAETNQLAFFLDLAHFEQSGRTHRGHVQLRKNTMTLYGPGGKMSGGKAVLFVELCVLKSGDLDAEYIGCREGTGLMVLKDFEN